MRLQILERIDKLEETHCQSCTIYPDDFVKRERYCIAKGQNMTTSDMLYLLDRKHVFELADAGMNEKEVAQVLDMNKNTLSNYFTMWRKERDGKSN